MTGGPPGSSATPVSSEDLAAAAGGNEQAFMRLVRAHEQSIYAYVLRMADCDADTADDIAQEVFVTAWRKLGSFRGEAALRTWLIGIAKLKIRSYRRSLKRAVSAYRRLWHEQESASMGPSTVFEDDEQRLLAQGLRQLSPKLREPLHLHVFEAMDYETIAGLLRVPVGTVKSRIHAARERLRRYVAIAETSNTRDERAALGETVRS